MGGVGQVDSATGAASGWGARRPQDRIVHRPTTVGRPALVRIGGGRKGDAFGRGAGVAKPCGPGFVRGRGAAFVRERGGRRGSQAGFVPGRAVLVSILVAALLLAAGCRMSAGPGARGGPSGAAKPGRASGLSARSIPVVDPDSGDTLARLSELLDRADLRPGARRPDYGPLIEQVRAFIATRPQTFGIYFKDLQTGATWGINEREPIHAASTIKVPLVLYVNHQVAAGRARMDDRVVYEPDRDLVGGAGILQRDGFPGKSYSLRILTNLSITISDNVATNMLFRHFGKDNVGAFMRSLGGEVIFPEGRRISTARDMGRYVEAVLDFARRHPLLGGRMLDDMGHSIFHVGLPGLLPQKVFVAHKEGDIAGVADDVGIVFSDRPYVLAILSKGVDDIDRGFEDIARISKIVYDFQEKLGPVR